MAQRQDSHRLAVILHADVVDSTTLVQRDERLAHERITAAFQRASKTITRYNGIVHEIRGDALVAEFARASDAVSAALEFQRENAEHNSSPGDDIVPEIRVGVALGEVVIADATVTGAGVVLAQRIEQLADPGGVCITEAIHEALPNRLPYAYEALGIQSLKGFEQHVHVHKVQLPPGVEVPPPSPHQVRSNRTTSLAAAAAIAVMIVAAALLWLRPWQPDTEPASLERLAFALPDEPSIAVLPFKNLSGDAEQDYLADGFTEVIITTLSRTPELFVIANNSTQVYKDHAVQPAQVAEEQGVRYVLEGSVQRSDTRVRIDARLVDALSGDHVWAERYDYPFDDLFAAQDDITHNIAVAMQVQLTHGDEARSRSLRAANPKIFELTQKSVFHFRKFSREDSARARELAEQALAIAPDDLFAQQLVAWADYQQGRFGWSDDRDASLRRAEEIARRTIALDDEDPEAYFLLSFLLPLRGELDEAIAMGEKAVALNPNHANAVAGLATNLSYAGRPVEAIPLLNKAMRLSPYYPVWFDSAIGLAYMMTGDYEDSISALDKVVAKGALLSFTHSRLTAVYALKGDLEKARAHAAKLLEIDPDYSIREQAKALPYKHSEDLQRELEALRLAGLPETPPLALPDKPSIAVLPFRSLGGDSDQQFMADGLTQNIITTLSAIPELFVIGRSSVFKYQDKDVDAAEVARELGVRYVLEGSLQSSKDKIRINAELVDTRAGDSTWSERYDRPLKDVFEIQDSITLNIVSGLTGKILDVASELTTDNLQAWVYGVKALEQYWRFTRESIFKARELADKALALDPNYAGAMLTKAYSHYFAGRVSWEPFDEALANAEELVERLQVLDPDSARLSGLIGALQIMQGHHEAALRAADRAIVLSPGSAVWHAFRGWFLYEAGRHEESVDALRHAIRLNPLRPSWYDMYFVRAHVFLDLYDEAIARGEEALVQATSPATQSFLMISIAFAQSEKGDLDAARAKVKEAVRQAPWMNQKMYRWFYRTQNPADLERFIAAMARAGMPEGG